MHPDIHGAVESIPTFEGQYIMNCTPLRKSLALVSVTLFASLGLCAQATNGTPVTLKADPVAGAKLAYTVDAKIDFGGSVADVTGTWAIKVNKVNPDGSWSETRKWDSLTVNLGGQVITPDAGSAETIVYNPDHSLKDLTGESVDASAFRLETINSVILPKSPVTVGQTWTTDIPANSKTGVVHSSAAYTLVGDDKVGADDCWKISATVKELEGDSPASNVGTIWLRKSDMLVEKVDAKWSNVPFPNSPQPLSGSYKVMLKN